MTTTLIIVRHGNTFTSKEEPRRVGARTDLPLTSTGLIQAKNVAHWLKNNHIQPHIVLTGPLKRHTQMAAATTQHLNLPPAQEHAGLTEIDYGEDENQTEQDVIARIGTQAIARWNTDALVPQGWRVDPAAFRQTWADIATQYAHQTVVAFTSNGSARFALDLFPQKPTQNLKLGTGCIGLLTKDTDWHLAHWNIKPEHSPL